MQSAWLHSPLFRSSLALLCASTKGGAARPRAARMRLPVPVRSHVGHGRRADASDRVSLSLILTPRNCSRAVLSRKIC